MTELTELRTCKGCQEKKPLTEYYKYRKNSYRGKCKGCFQKNVKKWRNTNKDLYNEQCNRWVTKNRDKWNEYRRDRYDPEKEHIRYIKRKIIQ